MSEEKLQFNRRLLFLGNLELLAWIFLASLSVLFYNQLYGWIYLILLAFIVYGILRRLGCSSCYNCKECTSGFGRLAGAFFGKGYIKKASVGNRIGIIVFLYILLFAVPLVLLSLSLLDRFSYIDFFVLISIVCISAHSLSTWFSCTVTKKA